MAQQEKGNDRKCAAVTGLSRQPQKGYLRAIANGSACVLTPIERPSPNAAALIIAFGIVWAGYFAMSQISGSLHQDMTEAYVWGQEFRLGYHQHPPFWAWICGAWFAVWPRTGWAFALLSALNATIGLWGAWLAIGRFAVGDRRWAAAAMLALTPFYSFFAFKYNANSIFVSLWPWTLYVFDRSVTQRRLRESLALGALIAAGLLSKYFALIFCATLFAALLVRPDGKAYLRSNAPYLSLGVAAVLVTPHIVWLIVSGAPPLRYLEHVSGLGVSAALGNVQATFFGSIAALAAPIMLTAVYSGTAPGAWTKRLSLCWREPRWRELTLLAFLPLALSLAVGLILQVKLATVMLIGAFPLAPLWMIETLPPVDPRDLSRLSLRLAVALSVGALLASPLVALWGVWGSKDPKYLEPRQELAAAATLFWRQTIKAPLLYVAGTPYYDDAVVFYSSERPHAFSGFDLDRNRWVSPEKLAAAGLLSVCLADDVHCREETKRYGGASAPKVDLTLTHGFLGRGGSPYRFVVTAIPPR
jgi:4-amino-4-deoxy-L-arabinose transferase-like glycosyltransferase